LSDEEFSTYQELSKNYSLTSLLEMLELIYPFFHQPTRPFLSHQQFETLLILLMKKSHRPSISAIVERLEELEKKLVERAPFSPTEECIKLDTPLETPCGSSLPIVSNSPLAARPEERNPPAFSPLFLEKQTPTPFNPDSSDDLSEKKLFVEEPLQQKDEKDNEAPLIQAATPIATNTSAPAATSVSVSPSLTLLPASVRHQNLIQFALVEWNAVPQ
jgi:hypothetical protein